MKYTKELLEVIVSGSTNYSETVRKITGKDKVHGSQLVYIKIKIEEFGIDTSHFNGTRWCAGKINPTGKALTKEQFSKYLKKNGPVINSPRLKSGLIKYGYKQWVCEKCNNHGIWENRKLCLQIDHIDGDSMNNELENLRILCPNCHSQTETYTGKNNGRLPELVMAQS